MTLTGLIREMDDLPVSNLPPPLPFHRRRSREHYITNAPSGGTHSLLETSGLQVPPLDIEAAPRERREVDRDLMIMKSRSEERARSRPSTLSPKSENRFGKHYTRRLKPQDGCVWKCFGCNKTDAKAADLVIDNGHDLLGAVRSLFGETAGTHLPLRLCAHCATSIRLHKATTALEELCVKHVKPTHAQRRDEPSIESLAWNHPKFLETLAQIYKAELKEVVKAICRAYTDADDKQRRDRHLGVHEQVLEVTKAARQFMTGPEDTKTKDFVSWTKTPAPAADPAVEARPVEYEQSFEDAYVSDCGELYTGLDYDGEFFYRV